MADHAPGTADAFKPSAAVKILIIEDDPIACAVLQGLLQALGHEFTIAVNGEEGWDKFSAETAKALAQNRV